MLTAAEMLVALARCCHEHLHAARPAEMMLSEILQGPRRDRRRQTGHQVSEMLPHHSVGMSASSLGRAKELPRSGNQQRSLGLRMRKQKAIEVAVCRQEVQKELSQRGP